MRNPVLVLKSIEEKSKDQTYKYERLYRNLYNPDFYLLAYKNIAASPGSMTAGSDGRTLRGMSVERIEKIIATLKDHSYQPKPARRVYIHKKNSNKKRPLGIPSTDDKLVQEIVRMILEAIYEPTFSNASHGFRPNRSGHTALSHVRECFTGMKWIIEGDIKACFDSFDHHVLIGILRKRIQDEYFISLMWKFLKAGYMEQWEYHTTFSGTPQGSGMSPILANIYLTELDVYMEEYKKAFDMGSRKPNPPYRAANFQYKKHMTKLASNRGGTTAHEHKAAVKHIKSLRNAMLKIPSYLPIDPSYKRIQYNRYADDFVIGVIGSQEDAEKVKSDIKRFICEKLKLTLSEEKTSITHSSEMIRYLGYDFTVSRDSSLKRDKQGRTIRAWSGRVRLYVPKEKWMGKLLEYQVLQIKKDDTGKERWVSLHRGKLINRQDIEIISKYNAEIRSLYNYYRLAENVSILSKFAFIMEYSMYKTFAAKYKSTVKKIRTKYNKNGVFGVEYTLRSGEVRRCEFYHDGFNRCPGERLAYIDLMPQYGRYDKPNSLAIRIKHGVCELCGEETDSISMHHIKKMADLTGQTIWELLMRNKRMKTLALCPSCYEKVQNNIL